MTYATCEDCGSVGRFHYSHCKNGDQPRVEIGEGPELLDEAADYLRAHGLEAEAKDETAEERFRKVCMDANPFDIVETPKDLPPGTVDRIVAEVRAIRWPADLVNHPPHYTQHPSGVECIQIVEHMNFCRGNAVKYIWRAGDKGNEIEDLKKARWYLDREIERLQNSA